jgi:hypothetical protein
MEVSAVFLSEMTTDECCLAIFSRRRLAEFLADMLFDERLRLLSCSIEGESASK